MSNTNKPLALLAGGALLTAIVPTTPADAQRGGGRAGAGVSHGGARNMQVRGASTSNVRWSGGTSVSRDVNRGVNRDVNVDVDHHYDYDWGDNYHPVARAATAAAVTAAVVGTYYRYLPANCATIYRGTVVYYQCGSSWYRPVYAGTSVQYIVVTAP